MLERVAGIATVCLAGVAREATLALRACLGEGHPALLQKVDWSLPLDARYQVLLHIPRRYDPVVGALVGQAHNSQ